MEEFKETYKTPLSDFEDGRVDLPKTFKIISCPNCATEIPADNLSISDKIGKCGSCQAVFSIEKDIHGLQQSKQKISQEILRPEGIELFQFKEELEISFEQPVTWMEWVFLTIISLLWIPGIAMSADTKTVLPFLILAVIPSIITFIYITRRKVKHRKFIAVDNDYLSVMWRPKKFNANQRYAVNDISQVYVKYNPNVGSWQVKAIVDEGHGQKHVKLTSLKTASKAKYLEQVIESHLGIQDVVVPEES